MRQAACAATWKLQEAVAWLLPATASPCTFWAVQRKRVDLVDTRVKGGAVGGFIQPGGARARVLAAAAWGAFVFVVACPHDDPLYIAVWYVLGCSLVTVAARIVLPALARW